jgi:hypothetical protein
VTDCLVCGDPATSGLNLDANAVSRGDKAPPSDENHHTRPQGHPDTPSRQEAP